MDLTHQAASDQAETWKTYNAAKENLRQRVWRELQVAGGAIANPVGHIPNFVGAMDAAERLAGLPCWQQATVVKCNPDAAQEAVRLRALQDGKQLYMAVPRLTQHACFVELSAARLQEVGGSIELAASKSYALRWGKPVWFDAMHPIDLAVVGCVAASSAGGRTGKGAGFADLELAMLREFGLILDTTVIVTTVHEGQLVTPEELPLEPHDWPLDWVITPTRAIATSHTQPRPQGLDWSAVQPDQWARIPVLNFLKTQQNR